MNEITEASLIVPNKGGRPRVPESERLVQMVIWVRPKTFDGAAKLARLHDIPLSQYGRRVVERAVSQSIDTE